MLSPELNLSSKNELRREIGRTGMSDLNKLGHWLGLTADPEGWESWEHNFSIQSRRRQSQNLNSCFIVPLRFAPSLICKGEVELYGRSMPRFAMRVLLEEGRGFINIRRLATLAGQLAAASFPTELIQTLLKAPCVADAFLVPPPWAANGWHILAAPLAKACGEIAGGQPDVALTPYARHMKPGGGMCAQAVCFMATALHATLDAPVHGVPEVTAIATETEQGLPRIIEFDGLWTDQLSAYFNNQRCAPLGATWQAAKLLDDNGNRQVLADPNSDICLGLKEALRSYVLSNMPVIFPVDVGRMQGFGNHSHIAYQQPLIKGPPKALYLDDPLNNPEHKFSVFRRNGLRPSLTDAKAAPEVVNHAHVVLVVGCNTEDPDPWTEVTTEGRGTRTPLAETEFVCQDPANFPFMRATAHELLLAACYDGEPEEIREFTTLSLGFFLPVTPRAVSMPLLDEALGTGSGIQTVSTLFRKIGFSIGNLSIRKRASVKGHRSQFRLVTATQKALLSQKAFRFMGGGEDEQPRRAEVCAKLVPQDTNHWCWLETNGEDVLLWDAEHPAISKDALHELDEAYSRGVRANSDPAVARQQIEMLAQKMLIAAAVWNETQYGFYTRLKPKPAKAPKNKPVLKGTLRPAVMSSFETVKEWSSVSIGMGREPVEVYLLMQALSEQLLTDRAKKLRALLGNVGERVWDYAWPHRMLRPRSRICALELMARAHDDPALIERTAAAVHQSCTDTERPPIALATYLPSLCAGERDLDQPTDNRALRDRDRVNDSRALLAAKFVLRVAKSLKEKTPGFPKIVEVVGGSRVLGPADLENAHLSVRCIENKAAVDNILACVKKLLVDLDAADVLLAFEYEPSVLTALGSLADVIYFCKELEKRSHKDRRWDRVGLNIDIAHWAFLGKYGPETLSPVVKKRIFHAHVSSHVRGHLSDAPLEDEGTDLLHTRQDFVEWFALLEEVKRTGRFQGYISFEQECCKNPHYVQESLQILSRWLLAG